MGVKKKFTLAVILALPYNKMASINSFISTQSLLRSFPSENEPSSMMPNISYVISNCFDIIELKKLQAPRSHVWRTLGQKVCQELKKGWEDNG